MKHKCNIYLTLTCVTLACISLAGCVKELGLTRFGIAVEQYGGGGKLVVTTNGGVTSAFVAGDTIRINGQKGVVAGDADGLSVTFSEAVTPVNDKYHALYPASLFTSQGADGSIAVDLPSEYNYEEDGSGNQLIDIPLAAVSKNNKLLFRHLTGALVVQVPPVANENIVLDYIMVESSGTPLHGTGTVTFDGDGTPTLSLANDPDKSHVTMYFPTAASATLHSSDSAKRILIPVPAVPESNRFTITVCAHQSGSTVNYYFFHKTQETGGALARNKVGYVPVDNMTSQRFVGSGTADDPYLINNRLDYKRFLAGLPVGESDNKQYIITYDIDMGGGSIQTAVGYFTGVFDGGGHTISNAVVNETYYNNKEYLAIFPRIWDGIVKNLTISNITLNQSHSDNTDGGGLSTEARKSHISKIIIDNVRWGSSSILGVKICLGGLVGRIEGTDSENTIIDSCEIRFPPVNLNIHQSSGDKSLSLGGLIGVHSNGNLAINNCEIQWAGQNGETIALTDYHGSYASRYSHVFVGGIVGYSYKAITFNGNILVEGNLDYTGNVSFLRTICGRTTGSINSTNANLNTTYLTIRQRSSPSSSSWTTVTLPY